MRNPEHIRKAMELYAVTDRAWLHGRSLASCVEEALKGGATFIQLREKDAPEDEVLSLAQQIKELCVRYHVPFVIDDDVTLAQAVGADGVHVGQSDMECAQARAKLGPDAIVGVSAQTVDQAVAAQAAGADYLGVGAMFGTPTKPDAELVSFDELKAIVEAVDIPVVAIGGLNLETIPDLAGSGIDGVAVVSAIFAHDDIRTATAELLHCVKETLGKD